jgi:1-acyl-sn-glycerol-3-phosphate acyltransferase
MSPSAGANMGVERVPLFYKVVANGVRIVLKVFFRLQVTGLENVPRAGPCILVANHASYFDPLVLGSVIRFRPVRFMARSNLFRHGGLGWFLRHSLVVPIHRDRGDVGALRQGVGLLNAGAILGIFPEGTRTADGSLQKAKGGIGFLIARSGAPVVPVYIAGTYRAWPRHRRWPRLEPLSVHIGRQISPDETASFGRDYAAIAERVMAAIAALREDVDADDRHGGGSTSPRRGATRIAADMAPTATSRAPEAGLHPCHRSPQQPRRPRPAERPRASAIGAF